VSQEPTTGEPGAATAARAAVVLASASRARRTLLENAGVAARSEASGVDEEELKRSLKAASAQVDEAAATLAELKARKVSLRHGGALVIGADQILECGGRWFDKPRNLAQARADLEALSGREHSLVSAVAVVRDGVLLWQRRERARLVMRTLSGAFIAGYLASVGPAACDWVGAYQVEGLGAQLFERIEGDYFTILGLPLLPLLDFLRHHGAVPT